MDYRIRDKVTEYLKLQAQALACLEAMIENLNEEGADTHTPEQLVKIQHEQVNLQTRFTRLMYL